MKVALLQTDIRWADAQANIRTAQALIDAHAGADLYVLPEMWSTGFATNPTGIAHDEHRNVALDWMCDAAADRQAAISGSVAVRLADGTYRNRHYLVDGRQGVVHYYDKHHLFTYGREDASYVAGRQHAVVNYCGLRLLLLTCYDLRFPGWCRYADGKEYDAIVLVANWPQARQAAWQILTRARAIENQCYFIGVNRVGDDPVAHYVGASVVVDPIGRTLVQAALHEQQVVTAELLPEELLRRRSKFRVLNDRD